MLYTGGGPEPVLSKSFARRYHAFKGSNCSKTRCHSPSMGRSVKTHHSMQIAYPQDGSDAWWRGISFFSFFYFDVFVLNSEPCKKWFPHRHWRCLVTPFRDVNYGSGEVCVFHFFLFCLLFCFVVWNLEKMLFFMKNYVWFWFAGGFWEKIMDYI